MPHAKKAKPAAPELPLAPPDPLAALAPGDPIEINQNGRAAFNGWKAAIYLGPCREWRSKDLGAGWSLIRYPVSGIELPMRDSMIRPRAKR